MSCWYCLNKFSNCFFYLTIFSSVSSVACACGELSREPALLDDNCAYRCLALDTDSVTMLVRFCYAITLSFLLEACWLLGCIICCCFKRYCYCCMRSCRIACSYPTISGGSCSD